MAKATVVSVLLRVLVYSSCLQLSISLKLGYKPSIAIFFVDE
jgi:hypothetical protein